MAKESKAEYLTDEKRPEGLEIISLPGHFFDMVGFRTSDDVVFLADCLSSKQTLDKYGIGVLYDLSAYIDTLEAVKAMKAKLFIPSHAEPTEDIVELAQYNIDKVKEITEKIVEICKEPLCFDIILKKLFDAYGLTVNPQQYVLIGSTLRSYLSYLLDNGRLELITEDNMLLFKV